MLVPGTFVNDILAERTSEGSAWRVVSLVSRPGSSSTFHFYEQDACESSHRPSFQTINFMIFLREHLGEEGFAAIFINFRMRNRTKEILVSCGNISISCNFSNFLLFFLDNIFIDRL